MSANHGAIELSTWPAFPGETLNLHPRQLYDNLPVWLRPSTIRILDLDGDNGNPETPLSGGLRLVNFEDSPEYSALSYVWGTWSSPKDTISCDKCKIEVTTNCHRALVSLRKLFGAITIWVDSICIDQENDLEKALQIPLMEEIYTYA